MTGVDSDDPAEIHGPRRHDPGRGGGTLRCEAHAALQPHSIMLYENRVESTTRRAIEAMFPFLSNLTPAVLTGIGAFLMGQPECTDRPGPRARVADLPGRARSGSPHAGHGVPTRGPAVRAPFGGLIAGTRRRCHRRGLAHHGPGRLASPRAERARPAGKGAGDGLDRHDSGLACLRIYLARTPAGRFSPVWTAARSPSGSAPRLLRDRRRPRSAR
jgi:hypothetical protein